MERTLYDNTKKAYIKNVNFVNGLEWCNDILEFKPLKLHGYRHDDIVALPVFKRPIEICSLNLVGKVFRVCAVAPTIAIACDGTYLDLTTNKIMKQKNFNKKWKYKTIDIYVPVDNKISRFRLHRLIAMTWHVNDDYITKNIVDHKDEDKTNVNCNNLQWVTLRTNASRYSNGTIEPRYRIKNTDTGELLEMESFKEISEHIGVDYSGWRQSRLPLHIVTKNTSWLIEDAKNFTNWSLEDSLDASMFPYKIKVDGIIRKFRVLRDVYKYCGVPGTIENITHITEQCRIRGLELSVSREKLNKLYDVKDTNAGKEYTNLTLSGLISITEAPRGTVLSRINPKYRYGLPLGKWLIKLASDETYPTIITNRAKKQMVTFKNNKTDNIITFASRRKAAVYFKISRFVLNRCIDNNLPIRGIYIPIL